MPLRPHLPAPDPARKVVLEAAGGRRERARAGGGEREGGREEEGGGEGAGRVGGAERVSLSLPLCVEDVLNGAFGGGRG